MKPTSLKQKSRDALKCKSIEEGGVLKPCTSANNCRPKEVENPKRMNLLSCISLSNNEGDNSLLRREPDSETRAVHEPTPKLKLQLFPIDGHTRQGLEEDGHIPHLELILSGKKKISSVVKHLISKWGNSKVAIGELILSPYCALENASDSQKWSLKDVGTSIADIQRAVGCPVILRLRYGWFQDAELQIPEQEEEKLLGPIDDNCLCLEDNQVLEPKFSNLPNSEKLSQLDSNVDDKEQKDNDLPWIDCLPVLSFEDLLATSTVLPSEVTQAWQVPAETNSRPLRVPPSCDSFDAAIAFHLSRAQALNRPTNVATTSIWDGEETCHAFPLKKHYQDDNLQLPVNAFTLFPQDILPAQAADMEDKPFLENEILTHEKTLHELPSEEAKNSCHETATDMVLQFSDQNSKEIFMDLANINWESQVSTDLFLSSRTVVENESVGFGNLLASSSDGQRSCSFSKTDKINTSSFKLNAQETIK